MKVFKYICIVFLVLVLLFVVLPIGLLQLPAVQKELGENVANYIGSKVDSKVEIEKIEFRSINKLVLRHVYVEDQQGDTLFTAARIAAGIELMPILRRQYRINSAQLFAFDLRLQKETTDSPLNIQYIIDAFTPEEKKEKTPVEINIKKIHLHGGRISYDIDSKEVLSDRFDANHISVDKLSGKIHLNKLKDDQVDLILNRLRFKEKSGLEINNLSAGLEASPEQTRIERIFIALPHSELIINDIKANYQGYDKIFSDETELSATIRFPKIDFDDLDPLLPGLSALGNDVLIEADLEGTMSNMTVKDIHFKEDYGSFLRGQLNIKNLASENSTLYINAEVRNSLFRANYLKGLAISDELERVGDVVFKGSLSGYLSNLTAIGVLNTDIGNLTADFSFGRQAENFLKGRIASQGFELGVLSDNSDLGRIVFDFDLDSKWKDKTYSVEIIAHIPIFEFQGYAYDGIDINGQFSNYNYNGLVSMDGAKGKLRVEGSMALSDVDSYLQILIDAQDVQLDEFRFARKYDKPVLSLSGNIDFTGNEFDNVLGHLILNDFALTTEKESFRMDSLSVAINRGSEMDNVIIRSDILDAEIEGNYSTRSLSNQLERSLAYYLPSLLPDTVTRPNEQDNIFAFHAIIGDTQDLFSLLKFPFRMSERTVISGFYNNVKNQLHAEAFMPRFDVANFDIDSCFIALDNRDDRLDLNVRGISLGEEASFNIIANFLARNDSIHSQIEWKSSKQERFEGELDMMAHLSSDPNLKGDIFINKTEMIFNDSIWTLFPTQLYIDKDLITINKLRAEHKSQFVYIDGTVSKQPEDVLFAELGSVDLEYIFNTLDIPSLEFGGKATGIVKANDLFHTRELNTQLDISDFTFNKTLFGDLDLNGTWKDEDRGIELTGYVAKSDSTSSINIYGMIHPVAKELSIHFYPRNADIAFLRKYINNIAGEISGEVSGHVHLLGDLNDPTVEGEVDVKGGRFGIRFLNTWYNFDHHISMTPDRIWVNNMLLRDDNGNTANTDAWVTHNLFSDFRYQADLSFSDFFVFNATEKTNSAFYGQVFGTGSATISGTEQFVNMSVSMQNTPNTNITFNFVEKRDIEEYSFITFKERNPVAGNAGPDSLSVRKDVPSRRSRQSDGGTDIRLNLLVNINDNAEVNAIMDPVGGDMITAKGNGHLEVQYATHEPLKLMGKYTIDEGQYEFSLEQLYFRKFVIHQGSSINFMGDPMHAVLDLKAAHRVQANLGDLDQQLLSYSPRSKVPVDCVINVSGQLEHPAISFDIELPDASGDLERQVKSYIRTDDMLNRQMLYLLVLNRFYTSPEYATSNTRANNDLSLLTSTLSTQLSNLLGSLNDKVQIGTQFHQSYEGDHATTEVEVMLSSMLFNNRLILYGNLGYIDNPYINNANGNNVPLVGDFDVEYKLTPNGDIRLKGFNHYNYRNYFSIAPEWTQGVGILFRRDFNNLSDLFGRKKKSKEQ